MQPKYYWYEQSANVGAGASDVGHLSIGVPTIVHHASGYFGGAPSNQCYIYKNDLNDWSNIVMYFRPTIVVVNEFMWVYLPVDTYEVHLHNFSAGAVNMRLILHLEEMDVTQVSLDKMYPKERRNVYDRSF